MDIIEDALRSYRETYAEWLEKELRASKIKAHEPEAMLKDVMIRELSDEIADILGKIHQARIDLSGRQ